MLVLTNIANISIEDLTNLEDTSGFCIFLPEWLLDVGYSVNSNSIKAILIDSILYPGL